MSSASSAQAPFDDESQEDFAPLISTFERDESSEDVLLSPNIVHMLVLSGCFGALQLVFALVASYGSTHLMSIGVSSIAIGLTWLAGPLSGTIVQPLIGILSDRWGHQKLIVNIGLAGLILSLLGLGWAPALTGHLQGPIIDLVVVLIFTLNMAVQPVQLGLRVLFIKLFSPEQQMMASAWATRMIAIGNILAQLAGSVDTTALRPYMTGDQFKNLCLLTSFGLAIAAIALTLFVPGGNPARSLEKLDTSRNSFSGLWKILRTVSPGVVRVWRVQMFSWVGWFQFLYYVTMYIDYLALRNLQSENFATHKGEQQTIKQESLRMGSGAMLVNACVSLLAGILLPWLFRKCKGSDTRFRSFVTLPNLWMLSQIIFGVGMISTLWVSSVVGATTLIGILGLSWCCTGWIPFALISRSIAQQSREFSGSQNPGFLFSLHNVSIAAPQILGALISGLIFSISQGDENQSRYVLAVGGVFGLGAAWLARDLSVEENLGS